MGLGSLPGQPSNEVLMHFCKSTVRVDELDKDFKVCLSFRLDLVTDGITCFGHEPCQYGNPTLDLPDEPDARQRSYLGQGPLPWRQQ